MWTFSPSGKINKQKSIKKQSKKKKKTAQQQPTDKCEAADGKPQKRRPERERKRRRRRLSVAYAPQLTSIPLSDDSASKNQQLYFGKKKTHTHTQRRLKIPIKMTIKSGEIPPKEKASRTDTPTEWWIKLIFKWIHFLLLIRAWIRINSSIHLCSSWIWICVCGNVGSPVGFVFVSMEADFGRWWRCLDGGRALNRFPRKKVNLIF